VKPEIVWHYTVIAKLEEIEKDKLIQLASAGWTKDERLAVWFSANPLWENTVAKVFKSDGTPASLQEHWLLSHGQEAMVHDEDTGAIRMEHVVAPEFQPARIGVAVATAPYRWDDFKRLSGVSPKIARGLYQKALSLGARPGEWYVSFEPVPAEKWLSVQLYDGKEWKAELG